jgi:hypothetical protein
VGEELPYERIAIGSSLGKQKQPGGKTVDAMHYEGPLLFSLEFFGKQRPSGRDLGAFNWHRQKPGRFVQNDHGIVLVKNGDLPGESRRAPLFTTPNPIWHSWTAARFRRFLHWCPERLLRAIRLIKP